VIWSAILGPKTMTSGWTDFRVPLQYTWQDGVRDSVPVKAYDDGMDALRYAVMYVDKGGWSLEQIAAWGRGESSVKTPASSPPAKEPEPKPEPREPEKPAETPEEKQRRWEEEVAEMNRKALLRAPLQRIGTRLRDHNVGAAAGSIGGGGDWRLARFGFEQDPWFMRYVTWHHSLVCRP
jgi:hypothetical protein